MAVDELQNLDIVYDDKAWGNAIDPTQWNANFKKIEVIVNGNTAIVNNFFAFLDALNLSTVPHSTDIKSIRIDEDLNIIEYTLDGVEWIKSSGGHTILDASGNILPQRTKMQFTGESVVTDVDGITVVSGVKGEQGIQGIQGEQGIQGIQGLQGIQGEKGDTGDAGNGIASIVRTSGDGSAGSIDTYTITFTDATTTTFNVYNGVDGEGAGDMLKTTYDATNNGIVDNAEKVNGHTVDKDVPSNALFTDTVYTHPTTAGNKHVPTGGATNQILKYGGSSGTASWANMSPATSTVLGCVLSGTDITVDGSGNVSVNDDSHNHIISNIDNLQTALDLSALYSIYNSSVDANGIYTVVDFKRGDGTLYMKSILSGGTSPNYTTDTWQFYDSAGTTVVLTKTWTLTYDGNGKVSSKVVV